jgi:hypothetical protein
MMYKDQKPSDSSSFLHSICRSISWKGELYLVVMNKEDMLCLINLSLSRQMLQQYLEIDHTHLLPKDIPSSAIGTASLNTAPFVPNWRSGDQPP